MKKTGALLLTLLMALGLAACGSETDSPAAPAAPSAQESESDTALTTPSRAADSQLIYAPEGEETQVPATLYVGEGYSLYIPSEGWRLESEVDDGIPTETWENTLNDAVELELCWLEGYSLEEARGEVLEEEDDFSLTPDQQGVLTGMDLEDREGLQVRLFAAEGGVYVLRCEYPLEAAEGFGLLLESMAESFQLEA